MCRELGPWKDTLTLLAGAFPSGGAVLHPFPPRHLSLSGWLAGPPEEPKGGGLGQEENLFAGCGGLLMSQGAAHPILRSSKLRLHLGRLHRPLAPATETARRPQG